jgi:putative tryptophan/tyrosine transport system substrate-binding protein
MLLTGLRHADDIRKLAAELVKLAPDVILTSSSVVTSAMLQATRTIPIVFTIVIDPLGAGRVDSVRGRKSQRPD